MATQYIGPGNRFTIPAGVLTAPVTSGDLVLLGKTHAVVLNDGAANAANVGQVVGVFELPKDTAAGSGGGQGVIAYAKDDAGTLKVTADPTGATACGTFFVANIDADTIAQVKLHGGAVGVP